MASQPWLTPKRLIQKFKADDLNAGPRPMKAASIQELRKTLVKRDPSEMLEACLRLARFKKENKELLSYLLFNSKDEEGYVTSVCDEIDDLFESMESKSPYLAKKRIRKTIRRMETCLRYTAVDDTEIAVRIYFCQQLKASGIPFWRTKVTANMYESQLKKIDKVLGKFHKDIQSEYRDDVEALRAVRK